jgi:hypothetical protein
MATITTRDRSAAQASLAARVRSGGRAWLLLAAETTLVAILLHLVTDIQQLGEPLLFAVLFLGIAPLQILFGATLRREIGSVLALAATVVALVVLGLYVYSRVSTPHPFATGQAADVAGTVVLAVELSAVGGIGLALPGQLRRWTVRSLLGLGIAFWLFWFFALAL